MASANENEFFPIAFENWADDLLTNHDTELRDVGFEDVRRVREALYTACDAGFQRGAAVAFGLMGMAEAIRRRCPHGPLAARRYVVRGVL